MLIDFLLLLVYVYSLLLIGTGFKWILGCILPGLEGNEGIWLDLLYGLFAIGFISLLINFFIGVFNPITYLLIAFLTIIGIFRFNMKKLSNHYPVFLFILILTPIAYNMVPGHDGGLYHIPHQLWIRDEKIVFGLSNLHGRFGFSSFLEYILAPQWLSGDFKLFAFATIAFFLSFLLFLWDWMTSNDSFKFILATFVVINLIFFNSYLRWFYTYTDNSAGILFALAFLYGLLLIRNIQQNRAVNFSNLFVLAFLSFFSYLLKISSFMISIWLIYILILVLLRRQLSVKQFGHISGFYLALFGLWLVRGIITTGCLMFPVSASCLNLPWNSKQIAFNNNNWITAWARHPRTGLTSLENWDWLHVWWIPTYKDFFLNFIWVFLGLALFSLTLNFILRLRINIAAYKLIAVFLMLASLLFWFYKAPHPRFGVGVFILFTPIISFAFLSDKIFLNTSILKVPRIIRVFFIAIAATALSLNGSMAINFNHLLTYNGLVVPEPEVIIDQNYGVRPQEGRQCWMVPHCAPANRTTPKRIYGYLFFETR